MWRSVIALLTFYEVICTDSVSPDTIPLSPCSQRFPQALSPAAYMRRKLDSWLSLFIS